MEQRPLKLTLACTAMATLFILWLMFFGFQTESLKAAEDGEILLETDGIQYSVTDPDSILRNYQSVFHDKKEITTKPLSFNAGNGKIITRIVLKKIIKYYKP